MRVYHSEYGASYAKCLTEIRSRVTGVHEVLANIHSACISTIDIILRKNNTFSHPGSEPGDPIQGRGGPRVQHLPIKSHTRTCTLTHAHQWATQIDFSIFLYLGGNQSTQRKQHDYMGRTWKPHIHGAMVETSTPNPEV